MSTVKATIITIGDELLIGQVVDTNSSWIAQKLNELGIDVLRRVAVGDTREAIIGALDEEMPRADVLLLTGGLGPTADDITKPLLAEYFGGRLVRNREIEEHLVDLFTRRKRPIIERNLRQADLPDVCTILFNKMGTAPGMWFDRDGKVVVSMPGVPFEMMNIMEDEVLPRFRERYLSDAIEHRCIITAGEGESFIADAIQDLEEALPPHIRLAYLPQFGMVRLRLTGRAADREALIRELELHRDAIAGRIPHIVVSLEDLPLEHILGKMLTARGQKIGLAESCTGGYIAHRITQIMGSAGYFQGSLVCYQESAKEKILGVPEAMIREHGVVSEAVASAMAQGAMKALDADYGFGVTGLLSPGPDEDAVPVGTVWMAVCDREQTRVKEFRFHYDRLRNKEMAVQMALLLMWKMVAITTDRSSHFDRREKSH